MAPLYFPTLLLHLQAVKQSGPVFCATL